MRNDVVSGLCYIVLLALLLQGGVLPGSGPRGSHDSETPGSWGRRDPGPSFTTEGGSGAPTTRASIGAVPLRGARVPATVPHRPALQEPATTPTPRPQQAGWQPTAWNTWWEFNQHRFLRVKDAVNRPGLRIPSLDDWGYRRRKGEQDDSLRPTLHDIQDVILPALKRAIDDATERDVDLVVACMIALAKIGHDHPDFRLLELFATRLRAGNQEIRATAALSIGIAAQVGEEGIQLLVHLALDDQQGRKACAGSPVDERTRSFAIYGLGLAACKTTDVTNKTRILDALRQILADGGTTSRDIRVAVIQALGLLDLGGSSEPEKELLAEALTVLENYYRKPIGAGEPLSQSHCATSIARLLRRDHAQADHYRALFVDKLTEKAPAGRSSHDVARACVLALSQLCRPRDGEESPDAKYSNLLLDLFHDHEDEQVRVFSILALGQIGGEANKNAILVEFGKARTAVEKPWCALALGVWAFHQYEARAQASRSFEPDQGVGEALLRAMQESQDPDLSSALAIALGLCRNWDAADTMRARLHPNVANEELASNLCIGLALMQDWRSKETIRYVLESSAERPALLKHAAIALVMLDDKSAAEALVQMVPEGDPPLAGLRAAASALGCVGDLRHVTPLVAMLRHPKLPQASRPYFARALGSIADKELLPWNSKIAANINYRTAVETLTNQTNGVLDLR